jgi:hypothetical protein
MLQPHNSIQPDTYVINVHNKMFLNWGDKKIVFNQNQLAFAERPQLASAVNLQLGPLSETFRFTNLFRLQLSYTRNFPLRKR